MPRKLKSIHYLYKITCDITNRFYYGIHSTNKLNDGYFGGGTVLKRSIRKYGKCSHFKEILEYVDTRDELENLETDIISNNINDILCMNLTAGGKGFKCNHSELSKKKISDSLSNKKYEEIHGKEKADSEKIKRKNGVNKYWDNISDADKLKRIEKVRESNIKYHKENTVIVHEYTCPHCGKIGKGSGMYRWHFDKCKEIII